MVKNLWWSWLQTYNDFDDEVRVILFGAAWAVLWFCFFCILSHFLPLVGDREAGWITLPYWLLTGAWCIAGAVGGSLWWDKFLENAYEAEIDRRREEAYTKSKEANREAK